jgi:hypothetical protein
MQRIKSKDERKIKKAHLRAHMVQGEIEKNKAEQTQAMSTKPHDKRQEVTQILKCKYQTFKKLTEH